MAEQQQQPQTGIRASEVMDNMAESATKTALQALGVDPITSAVLGKVANAGSKLLRFALKLVAVCVLISFVIVTFSTYYICFPFNTVMYAVEAIGEKIRDGLNGMADSIVRVLVDDPYEFMADLYEIPQALESFAFSLMHPLQAIRTQEILNEMGDRGITPEFRDDQDVGGAYYDTADSAVIMLEGAFQKGWAVTLQTAKYRAEMVKSKTALLSGNKQVVDEYDDDVLWDESEYWADTAGWQSTTDTYKAGTFTGAAGATYRGARTGSETVITVNPPVEGNTDSPCYLDAILKIITLQNCAEQTFLEDDEGNIEEYGVTSDFGGNALEEITTAYQLLRIGGEVAGRGIKTQDLNTNKEFNSLYRIVTRNDVQVTEHKEDVEIQYISDYTTEVVTDEDGNTVYEDDGVTPKTKQVPVYDWKHDHYDAWVEVNVTVTYDVMLRPDTKEMIIEQMTETYTEEEKTAFLKAIDDGENDYYGIKYENMCSLYGLDPYAWEFQGFPGGGYGDGSGIGGGGDIGSGLTEEEKQRIRDAVASGEITAEQGAILEICRGILSSPNPTGYARSLGLRVQDGYCQRFVSDLFASAGTAFGQGRAGFASAHEGMSTIVSSDTNIPNGAAIYAYTDSQYDHVGIYCDGYVIESCCGEVWVTPFDRWWCRSGYAGWGTNGWTKAFGG